MGITAEGQFLVDAAAAGAASRVKGLLGGGLYGVGADDVKRAVQMALTIAVTENHPAVVDVLLDWGADVHLPGDDGKTAHDARCELHCETMDGVFTHTGDSGDTVVLPCEQSVLYMRSLPRVRVTSDRDGVVFQGWGTIPLADRARAGCETATRQASSCPRSS